MLVVVTRAASLKFQPGMIRQWRSSVIDIGKGQYAQCKMSEAKRPEKELLIRRNKAIIMFMDVDPFPVGQLYANQKEG